MAGTPMHQWNIGVDINLKQNLTLNLHHRGYAEVFTKWQTGTDYRTLPAGIFFDTSLHWQNAVKGLNTTFYIKNLADSDAVTPEGVNGGYVESVQRRRFGFNLKYSF